MRIIFMGTGEIGVPTLRALQRSSEHEVVGIVTQPDKPAGRDQKMSAPAIKAAAGESISILQPKRIKDRQSVEEIRAFRPEVIVVMAYGQILPRDVLEIPRLACLNLHASLLPRWRGAAPIQAAIIAGERETGITAMYMDEGLDTGDVLLQRKIDISPVETGASLHDRLGEIAPAVLFESLILLARGNAPRIPQDNALATHAPKLNREDGRIDWTEPAEIIERKIRAFNPWPGASTKIEVGPNKPRSLKIFSASIVDLSGKPGTLIRAGEGLVVATGKEALAFNEVQMEGKRRMKTEEFLRGFSTELRIVD